MSNTIQYSVSSGIAVITLNRPDKLNSLNLELLQTLEETINIVDADSNVRCVVVTGQGVKAFAAGADIAELRMNNSQSGQTFAERGQRVFSRIEQLRIPVIAAVNGFALGGGCELALACHLRFASETAKFGQPEINLGIIPGYGGTQRLPRLVGGSKALELILTGDMITAQNALSIGLVDRVMPLDELIDHTMAFARTIADKPPLALQACLESVRLTGSLALKEGLSQEAIMFGRICGTTDFLEGTEAFLQKRSAKFTGS